MNTKVTTKPFDSVSFCMDYEGGSLSEEEVIEGFQELINSGLAWQLQGSYGRQAKALIESGDCTRPTSPGRKSPAVGEIRSSGTGQGTLPSVGPFTFVARDAVRQVGKQQFRVVVYGAYNAGIIGSESNGIAVLLENPPSVIADELGCIGSGYYGPSIAQLELFDKLMSCPEAEFRATVNTAKRLRSPI